MDKVGENDKARESHVCTWEGGSVSAYVCAVSSPPLKHGTALGKGWALLVRVPRASFFPSFLTVKTFHQYPVAVGVCAGWCELGHRSPASALERSRGGPLLKRCKAANVQWV